MEKLSDPQFDAKKRVAQILVNAGLLGVGAGAGFAGLRQLKDLAMHKHRPIFDAGSQLYDPIETIRPDQDLQSKVAKEVRPGLWANIQKKRKEGRKPAKPGDEGYPDSKSWEKLTNKSAVYKQAVGSKALLRGIAKGMQDLPKVDFGSPKVDFGLPNVNLNTVYESIAKRMPDWWAPLTGADASKNWSTIGFGLPLATAGLVGGYSGMNALVNAYKNRQKSQALSQKEKEYRDAIKKQFETAMMDKSALDAAYDQYVAAQTKEAQDGGYTPGRILPHVLPAVGSAAKNLGTAFIEGGGQALSETGKAIGNSPFMNQFVIGPYAAALVGMLGAGGYLGHHYGRSRQKDKIMERAVLERRRARGLMQPLYAVPGSEENVEHVF